MIWIGIDAGSHTGFAVWNGKEFMKVDTLPIHRALEETKSLVKYYGTENVTVVFEDARRRTYLPRERNMSEYRGKLMGAGSVKRDCSIWEDFCTDYGIAFIPVPPQAGLTKWPAERFTKITGWTGRTSEHSRDAALLVYGK
jgi:hypothetical protein